MLTFLMSLFEGTHFAFSKFIKTNCVLLKAHLLYEMSFGQNLCTVVSICIRMCVFQNCTLL